MMMAADDECVEADIGDIVTAKRLDVNVASSTSRRRVVDVSLELCTTLCTRGGQTPSPWGRWRMFGDNPGDSKTCLDLVRCIRQSEQHTGQRTPLGRTEDLVTAGDASDGGARRGGKVVCPRGEADRWGVRPQLSNRLQATGATSSACRLTRTGRPGRGRRQVGDAASGDRHRRAGRVGENEPGRPGTLEPTKGIARQSASSDGRLTLLETKGTTR